MNLFVALLATLLLLLCGFLLFTIKGWITFGASKRSEDLLREAFKLLSDDSSRKNSDTISSLMQPLKESLDKLDHKLREIEVIRVGAYESMREQVKGMLSVQQELKNETQKLNSALHAPGVRGRWGEMQLRRVVELSGMQPHCDFSEQVSKQTGDDGILRPDLVVHLPGNKCIVIDAKAPISIYADAMNEADAQKRDAMLKEHVQVIRRHMLALSKKSYWKQFERSPEFVVLFLPGEMYFSAALASDASLLEEGADAGVILATPTTLMAMLKAVYYGWKQEALAENTEKMVELSRELCVRIGKMTEHVDKLGRNLERTVESYNQTVGAMEMRVLSVARKIEDFGGNSGVTKISLKQIEVMPRKVATVAELENL